MCLGFLTGTKAAIADSVRADVSATYVSGFNRYCFQIINDDHNEPDPKYHTEHIASVTIKFISRDATAADHRFRNNVTGPNLWDAKVTIRGKEQQVVWTFGGYYGAGSKTKFTVEKPDSEKLEDLKVSGWPIWTKEASTFDWHYDDKETCYFLDGEVVVKTDQGEVSIGKGDLVTFPEGLDCTWKVTKPVRKHYRFGA